MDIIKKYQNIFPVQNMFSIFLLGLLFLLVLITTAKHIIASSQTANAVSIEPENGVLNGPVITGTDPNASNGQYVMFNSQAVLISNLAIFDTVNAKNYSVQSNIQAGNVLYGDRTYTIKTLPQSLAGSQWIRTANNSKTWNNGATLISFTINKQATIFIPVDTRLPKLSWMGASWVNSGLKMVDSEGHAIIFAIYQKTFPAGQVSLGPNAGPKASDMYTVILQ